MDFKMYKTGTFPNEKKLDHKARITNYENQALLNSNLYKNNK